MIEVDVDKGPMPTQPGTLYKLSDEHKQVCGAHIDWNGGGFNELHHVAFVNAPEGGGAIQYYYIFPEEVKTREQIMEQIDSLVLLLRATGADVAPVVPKYY